MGPMANPVLAASLDKSSHVVGETRTLTVTATDADNKTSTITVTGTDQAGNDTVVTVVSNIVDPVNVTVAEPGKTWVKQSTNGNVTVWTSVA